MGLLLQVGFDPRAAAPSPATPRPWRIVMAATRAGVAASGRVPDLLEKGW